MAVAPTLLVLAAGIGSRYGGLKQMDPMGPGGELLIDYSVYDALQAGFGRVVFIVRPEIEADFRQLIARRFEGRVPVQYVHQQLTDLPAGLVPPPGRQKPWGTGHAILCAAGAIREPFCVINGDDYYGPEAYRQMADLLRQPGAPGDYGMVAYTLRNTLSEHGHVARGVCRVSPAGELQQVTERTTIEQTATGARFRDEQGAWQPLTGDELVSLNFWGFRPDLFGHLEHHFRRFLAERGQDLKAEYFIPTVVDTLIQARQARVAVRRSHDRWIGVTYPQDKAAVQAALRGLIAAGVYPERLWA
jgi:NDP-sugar pyrophosphorylase family protein